MRDFKKAARRRLSNWVVNWCWHLLWAVRANMKYGFPARRLKVIGVTGTDGKTTTVSLIHHLLQSAGRRAAMISTVESKIGEREIKQAGLHVTSPHPLVLQKFLKQAGDEGCQEAVIEVSSHAIDQFRVWGIRFEVGILTNIAFEHTDYHGSFEKYKDAKINWLKKCQLKVIHYHYIYNDSELVESKVGKEALISFGLSKKADFYAKDINRSLNGLTFKIIYEKDKQILVQTGLVGDFNVLNILGAVAAAKQLDLSDSRIEEGLRTFKAPKGRFEVVMEKPFKVIIDFAHTPQAFEVVLNFVQSLALDKTMGRTRLIHVFGATGDRDPKKRPIMGEISARYAEIIILTSEDVYFEDPKKIAAMIKSGVPKSYQGKIYEILNRRKAIEKAIDLAMPGDVVLLTGVGHQSSINQKGKEVAWNEAEEVKKALKKTGVKGLQIR